MRRLFAVDVVSVMLFSALLKGPGAGVPDGASRLHSGHEAELGPAVGYNREASSI